MWKKCAAKIILKNKKSKKFSWAHVTIGVVKFSVVSCWLLVWKSLRINQNCFGRNRSTISQCLTICRIIEGVRAKYFVATLLFVVFSQAFDSIYRKDGANTTCIWSSHRNCTASMILYKKYESNGSLTIGGTLISLTLSLESCKKIH